MAEKKKKKTKTNPGAEAGFTQGMMTAKLLADSEERYGFVTPKSAIIKAVNAVIKMLSPEDMKRGMNHAEKVGKILSERDERLLDEPRKKASGGAVNKNYAYGGRVAKMSSEKS